MDPIRRRILAKHGDQGEHILRLQQLLNCRSQSGVFDDATESRVRGFQYIKSLPMTGEVDRETAKELGWTPGYRW